MFFAILKICGEIFIFRQDSAWTHRARETISLIACNFDKCSLNFKNYFITYSALNLQKCSHCKSHNTSNACVATVTCDLKLITVHVSTVF